MQRHHTFHEDQDMEAGAIHKTEIGDLVLVNGVARGGATLFFWAPKDMGGDDGLYYWGENPEHPSDGMVIAEPWASAQPVGAAEPVPTGKSYHGEIPEFGETMDYSAEEGGGDEGGGEDEDSFPESRQAAAEKLVAKLLESPRFGFRQAAPPAGPETVLARAAAQAGYVAKQVTADRDSYGATYTIPYTKAGNLERFERLVLDQYSEATVDTRDNNALQVLLPTPLR